MPVLVFYGVGGAGKTVLTKKAKEWLPEGLPSARLDLDSSSGQALYQNNVPAALVEIRRQFGVECPAFELAYAMLGFMQGGDQPTMRHHSAGSGAWEFVVEGGQALASGIPGASVVGWAVKKVAGRLGEGFEKSRFGEWVLSAIGNEDYFRLRRMDPTEIADDLFRRLGEDLAAALPERGGRACRAVLFLDTFEALRRGVPGEARQFQTEEWVRRIYACLDSVLLVVAGRDRVDWGETDAAWDHPRYLQHHLVGGLSEHDAREFLEKCGVAEAALQEAILGACVDVSLTDDRAYHAFSLALAVDAVREERKRFCEPDPASFRLQAGDHDRLAQRFLMSLGDSLMQDWVVRLSLTPSFDEAAARAAYEGEGKERAWRDLLDFSFIVPVEPGWWTLHARMTESLRHRAARDRERCRRWHEAWRDLWTARVEEADDRSAFHAWSHRWRLDPAAAQREWNQTVQRLRRQARTRRHYAMLDWWTPILAEPLPEATRASVENDLAVELTQGTIGDRLRDLQRAISLHESALRVRTEEATPLDWAMTQNNLGNALTDLPTGDRGANLVAAVEAYRAALRVYTEEAAPLDWAMTQFNLGLTLIQEPLNDRDGGLAALVATTRVWTEATAPLDWADSLVQIALLLGQDGQLAACRRSLRDAERGYRAVGLMDRVQTVRELLERLEAESRPEN